MKKLILIVLAACTIISCSEEEQFEEQKFDSEKYPQNWKLVKMTGSWTNSVSTGKNMDWQEYYLLKSDGTFSKHRERNGAISEVSGTFSIVNREDDKFVQLVHETNNEIIANCYSNQTESLWLKSDIELMNTWHACDGPKLEYKRVE